MNIFSRFLQGISSHFYPRAGKIAITGIGKAIIQIQISMHISLSTTKGLIPNLPAEACVEVACLVNKYGVQPTVQPPLPLQCAAMNMTNINVQLLTIEAARTRKRDHIYQAAMLDPHTAAELSIDDIRAMVDELIEAHGSYLPEFH